MTDSRKTHTLLLGIGYPDDFDPDAIDPEDMADIVVAIINEERQRNADEAGRSDYYKPVTVSGIPAAQWMTARTMQALKRAVELGIAAADQTDEVQ